MISKTANNGRHRSTMVETGRKTDRSIFVTITWPSTRPPRRRDYPDTDRPGRLQRPAQPHIVAAADPRAHGSPR